MTGAGLHPLSSVPCPLPRPMAQPLLTTHRYIPEPGLAQLNVHGRGCFHKHSPLSQPFHPHLVPGLCPALNLGPTPCLVLLPLPSMWHSCLSVGGEVGTWPRGFVEAGPVLVS